MPSESLKHLHTKSLSQGIKPRHKREEGLEELRKKIMTKKKGTLQKKLMKNREKNAQCGDWKELKGLQLNDDENSTIGGQWKSVMHDSIVYFFSFFIFMSSF